MRTLSSIVTVAMVLCVGAERLSAQTDGEREKRTITYDARWELHDYDTGFTVKSGSESAADSRLDGVRIERSTGDWRDPAADFQAPRFAPPPQQRNRERDTEESSRNWILPTLEGGLTAQPDEEADEPTGWGWLADEVEQRRVERDEARLAAQAAEEERAESEQLLQAEADDEPAEDEEAGAYGVGWVDEAAIAGNGSAGADAMTSFAVQDVEDQEALSQAALNAMDVNEPYGNADPWGNESASMSPWAEREAEGNTSGFGESAFGNSSSFGNSWERPQPRESAWRGTEPEVTGSSSASIMGGGAARSSADGLENRFGQSGAGGRSGARTDYTLGSAFGSSDSRSDWGGSWTSESGWSGSQPVSANTDVSHSLSTPRAPVRDAADSSSFRHNDSWLADPGR